MTFLRRLFEPEEKLSRPPTLAERAGAGFSRVASVVGVLLSLLALAFLVIVGIPAWIVVPRSLPYRAACDYALTNADLREHIGEILECDTFPRTYRIEAAEADFTFGVRGEIGPARLSVHVVRAQTVPAEIWHVTSGRFGVAPAGLKRVERDLRGG